jgi:hypothetical protein
MIFNIFVVACILCSASGSFLVQIGLDIDGKEVGEQSGSSVATTADGNMVAIGSPHATFDGTSSAGIVRVYNLLNATSWSQIGSDIGDAGFSGTGSSVSISANGDTLVIGAPSSVHNGYSNVGVVRVYALQSWLGQQYYVQRGSDIYGQEADDRAGEYVSLSSDGSIVAVGTPTIGVVRVYNWSDSDWVQMGLTFEEGSWAVTGDTGPTICLSDGGHMIAIGSPEDSVYTGLVRVYGFIGNSWTQLGGDIVGSKIISAHGSAVSLSGGFITAGSSTPITLAVGAYLLYQVKVYRLSNLDGAPGAMLWNQIGSDINSEEFGDVFGSSLSLSEDGNTLAIGAIFNDGNGVNSGQSKVYTFNGTTWSQVGSDLNGESAQDYSGSSISLSADATTLAIGAKFNDDGGSDAGHVQMFRVPTLTQTVCTSDQYESVAPTSTSDRMCTDLTVCTPGEYESVAPTSTSDRECTSASLSD